MDEAPARDFDRWVILSLRLCHGGLWLEYRDEAGTTRRAPEDATGPEHEHWTPVALMPVSALSPQGLAPSDLDALSWLSVRFPHLHVSRDLEALLRAGFSDLTDARHHWVPDPVPHSLQVPWLLPVFLAPPRGLEASLWELLVEPVVLAQPDLRDRCVLLRHAGRGWGPAQPIELPLVIRDASDPPADWLADIRAREWYASNPEVSDVGIRLEPEIGGTVSETRARSGSPHVRLERAARAVARRAGPVRLRRGATNQALLAAFNDGALDEALSGLVSSLPQGSSLLLQQSYPVLPDAEVASTASELVYALVHDFALHEILWILRQEHPFHCFLLASDPAANQALRLSRAMRRLVDETLALTLPAAGSNPSFERARLEVGQLAFDFSRESRGLTDMARLLAGSVRRARFAALLRGPDVHFLVRPSFRREGQAPARRADLALENYDAFGVLGPMGAYERRLPLRAGWRYRLRVHIGQRDEQFSAVEGDVPAIDPLLPPDAREKTQEIDVVVFEKSFTLLSPGVRKLQLPPLSGSQPVYFELRTPARPGPADLRVALYHGNNLLQSFVLEAEIARWSSEAALADRACVRIRLSSSGTQRFGNLGELRDRALSVALNQDAGGATHTVMLKKGGARQSVSLTEAQVERYTGEFRALLAKASNATGASAQRLFPVAGTSAPERDEQFASYLREIAKLGHDIWEKLLAPRGANTEALLELRRGTGQTVQFVRHGEMLPFPWQTIYDYRLPEGEAFRTARICFADTAVIGWPERHQAGCPHHPGEAVICIEGFWCVRHRLEQLSEDRAGAAATDAGATLAQDRVARIEVPEANPLVCLGVGNDDLPARELAKRLSESFGKRDLRILTNEDPHIEDILWDDANRPALLIVLSHLEPANARSNLPARIYAVVPKPPLPDNVLSDRGLLEQKLELKGWSVPPRPLVLLMACESAQMQLADLINLVDTLFGVGAAAVAGTESDVFSDLAADFAARVATGLAKQAQALGDVLSVYAGEMLRARNPMPFAFTVYGSADLTLQRDKTS